MSRFPSLREGVETPSLSVLCTAPPVSTTRLQYQCELITPMYGGGVEPGQVDKDMPIRATAIRGQLRFWWRILFGDLADPQGTFEKERELWGGLGSTAEDLAASLVSVRVSALRFMSDDIVPAAKVVPDEQVPPFKTAWTGPLIGQEGLQYALFSALGKCDPTTGEHNDSNPAPGTLLKAAAWTLAIEIKTGPANNSVDTDALNKQVEESVRWWAAFGGVGARTSRGFGAVRVVPKDTSSPLFVRPTEVQQRGCEIALFGETFNSSQATEKLDKVLEKFRDFRQGPTDTDAGFGRKRQDEPKTRRPGGRSRWPEADLVRIATDRWFGKGGDKKHKVRGIEVGDAHNHAPVYMGQAIFPRAPFGLPMIIHFADKRDGDPDDVSILPVHGTNPDGTPKVLERMASQILIRPTLNKADRGQIILFIFPNSRAPISCQIKGSNAEMNRLPTTPQSPLKPAWENPIDVLIEKLHAQFPTATPLWGKVSVQRNTNGVLTAQHPVTQKTAIASGDDAAKLFNALPADIRQKIKDRGRYHLLVTVEDGAIVNLEPAPLEPAP